ncbi:hypothetical protein N7474_003085 [Penicillium riverlandense]|uniref:uncharacterized protein n=1 Tax=Penicillium riverlandense TaxID=1903569 RepID=UPI002547B685|nr:uncharacterized protein N7474_003085 [Penicillium riverlandense]KAJ5825947.1 hypothetical protein N7474_003085 [Penicillium riverlandense]
MAGIERVTKRSPNACVRCRRQKIKCSGSQPCNGCSKRNLSCIFDDPDQKILVRRGYILELQHKIALIEQNRNHDIQALDTKDCEEAPALSRAHLPDGHDDSQELTEACLINPLSAGPPAFMSTANGRLVYLGTSSNWSFTRRVLSMAHEHIYQEALPTETLLFDGTTYEIGWDGQRTTTNQDVPVIPTHDHTLYLINAVKFRCGQLYHLYNESDFMESLRQFYLEDGQTMTNGLWYIHFLLILAFGKGFVQPKIQGKKPPGIGYFVKALQLLPEPNALCRDPMVSTEILCCIALYYQCLDCRSSAHNYIGQAMRMAMAQGMHTRMPVEYLGEHVVERCRKIWWTVYILDREMTSLMGLPQSFCDRYVQAPLPTSSDSAGKPTSFGMHIKLSQIIADINTTVYAIDGRINRTFLLSTKTALAHIAGLADELRESFPLHLDRTISGVSRTSAYLNLLYHQNVRNLMQMCLESAQHILNILNSLQAEGLLETFIPFDLESISVSTVILLMGLAVDPRFPESNSIWLERAYAIFDEMVRDGNQVANLRRSELQQLDETLRCISQVQSQPLPAPAFLQQNGVFQHDHSPDAASLEASMTEPLHCNSPLRPDSLLDGECDFGASLTSAGIMAMADSIESYETEWVSNAMSEHSIW